MAWIYEIGVAKYFSGTSVPPTPPIPPTPRKRKSMPIYMMLRKNY